MQDKWFVINGTLSLVSKSTIPKSRLLSPKGTKTPHVWTPNRIVTGLL